MRVTLNGDVSDGKATEGSGLASPALPVQVSLGEMPEDARISNGGPDPRSPEYWIAWSTCGAGSQAAAAASNGGRAAGWILVDDLLVNLGITLGDHAVSTCAEAVRVLSGAPLGLATDSGAAALSREVITAELNLSAGGETCDGAEATVAVGQSLLSSIGYGEASTERQPDSRLRALIVEATNMLAEYNRGALCRQVWMEVATQALDWIRLSPPPGNLDHLYRVLIRMGQIRTTSAVALPTLAARWAANLVERD